MSETIVQTPLAGAELADRVAFDLGAADHPLTLAQFKILRKTLVEAEEHRRVRIDTFELAGGKMKSQLAGDAVHALAGLMAHWFAETGGTNYIELSMYHEDTGPLVFTVQRARGMTPGQVQEKVAAELEAMRAERDALRDELETVRDQRDALSWR
jgi:hypothetical protein